jgi:hypothetical protein
MAKLEQVIKAFEAMEEVQALALSGSKGTGQLIKDDLSDFDLYVYYDVNVPIAKRIASLSPLFQTSSLGNSIYEETDNGDTEEGYFDIMYRSFDWIEHEIDDVWHNCNARTGYTTCFVFNLQHSKILFDKDGRLTALKAEVMKPYPDKLVHSIVEKNWPLIDPKARDLAMEQIRTALKRNDRNSIIHRVATYFASYFDILFAMNRQGHPGEKKLIPYSLQLCRHLPEDFINDMERTYDSIWRPSILDNLTILSNKLGKIIGSGGTLLH